jgi:hypothetical protein
MPGKLQIRSPDSSVELRWAGDAAAVVRSPAQRRIVHEHRCSLQPPYLTAEQYDEADPLLREAVIRPESFD